ncbi:helix-turn-helix domain-containing protein [Rhodococcus sp. NPDC058481]|uniref:helix-turn-helix domain-containing protein n=1 Tax=unclassified Rhodococcus (in: high G+C Gram-positive bacteria) TaxID=192944 RepID=UPI00365D5EE9
MSALRKSDVPVLTVKEVAGLFNCDQRTVSQALTQGALPSIRLGKRVFVPREPLLAMLTGSPVPDAAAAS